MADQRSERRLETLLGHLRSSTGRPGARPTSGAGYSHRYTVGGSALSSAQRAAYEEDGFVVVRGLVAVHKLDQFRERFREICTGVVKVPGLTKMRDVSIARTEFHPEEKAISKIQDFVYDPVLFQYCCLPEVLRYVQCITGPDIMAMHTMLINKPPDTGTLSSRHPMHQDLHYFPFRPADRIVCSWTAMEKVTRQNGCLVVVPGSHKGDLLSHVYPKWKGGVNKMYHGIQDYDPSCPRQHLDMAAGDTVFFHPLLIHGSGANRTTGFRKAISCHFASSHCYYVDTEGTTQDIIAKELMDVAERKYGRDAVISFQDMWRLRARCVLGEKRSL